MTDKPRPGSIFYSQPRAKGTGTEGRRRAEGGPFAYLQDIGRPEKHSMLVWNKLRAPYRLDEVVPDRWFDFRTEFPAILALPDWSPGDVEARVYDQSFGARMREARLARTARASDWSRLRKALRSELQQRTSEALSMLGDWVSEVALHDGHVAEVKLEARSFVNNGEALLQRAPWVHHLHITGYGEVGPSLFDHPALRGTQSLGLVDQALTDTDVEAMARSPHLSGLRWLDLSGNRLTESAYEIIALSSILARLAYVGLSDNVAPSPVDESGDDPMNGAIVETWPTKAGRALERKAGRSLPWLHAPGRFSAVFPPTPLDVSVPQ